MKLFLALCGSVLLSAVVAGSSGCWLGTRGVSIASCSLLLFGFFCSLGAVLEVGLLHGVVTVPLGLWWVTGSVGASWSVSMLDPLLVCTVMGVSLLVHLFSVQYCTCDPAFTLFLCWLSLFTFFMLVVIVADQFLVLLVGWEGIGVCSFALIGFWKTRFTAAKSALKAVLVNRLGDGLLTWSVLWVLWHSASASPELLLVSHSAPWVGLALCLGAIGKSAQIGFAVWLADAMEGPTPVSALIHAATLVTAGVIVISRTGAQCRGAFVVVGGLTSVWAATLGLCQSDAKRVIAYSTCSQLGFMMASHGLGHSALAIAHLVTHAGFKAALFLCAGAVIHAMDSAQDQRRYGGVSAAAPLLPTIATCSLAGLPFLSGFYTKDGILEACWCQYGPTAISGSVLLLVVVMTVSYGLKLCWSSFMTV